MIAVAMGAAGIMTRILAPSRGAFLTYGALEANMATAPGQLTASELNDLYRVKNLNEQTMITGLIGVPVAHSLSPQIHNNSFTACNSNAVYIPFEVNNLDGFMRRMVNPHTREITWNLRGLSVTAPHKTAVMDYLDWIEPAAIKIGAVNTVVVEADKLYGYNTDARAAIAPLQKMIELGNQPVAVIGAGGAARAVLWSLQQEHAKATIFARDTDKAQAVADEFGVNCRKLNDAESKSSKDVNNDVSFKDFAVVINTTPLGTRGAHELKSPVTASQLRGAALAYDLVYNPTDTLFLREARAAGLKVLGGLPMLVEQAAKQFELWTSERPTLEVMHRAAERRLAE